LQSIEDRAFSRRGGPGCRVVELAQSREQAFIDFVLAALDCECTLTRGRDESSRIKHLCGLGQQVEPAQSRCGQDDSVETTFDDMAQTGVDVSANGHNIEVWTHGTQHPHATV
jgi:hypothetical protein